MSGSISNSYSSSVRNPVKTIYIGGSSTTSGGGGGGGPNYWTLSGNNIYNNNTGTVGINTSNPDISYNLDVSGSVRIRGDLVVDGSSTIIDTNILKVEDPLIQLGINNPADLKAGGFYIDYRDTSNNKKYTGMVRPPAGSGYILINNSSIEPSDSYPDVSTVPTSYLSVGRVGVNKSLSSLSNFYVDISGLTRIWSDRVIIGSNAGNTGQDSNTIAIGNNAGNNNQGLNSVAIGLNSEYYLQQPNAIAIGRSAGSIAQGQNAVAMGYMAGDASQNTGALAIGFQAGRTFQGTNSIAIGLNAGEINQGCNSIAIGNLAGQNNQCNNTIVLNASGSNLGTNNPNGLYIDPIRNTSQTNYLGYNTFTKEVTYFDTVSTVNITDISAVGSTTYYPTFVDGTGNKPFNINSSNLIYRNQSLGLGTNTPSNTLDVSGSVSISKNINFGNTSSIVSRTGTNCFMNVMTSSFSPSVTDIYFRANPDASGLAFDLSFNTWNDNVNLVLDINFTGKAGSVSQGAPFVLGKQYVSNTNSNNVFDTFILNGLSRKDCTCTLSSPTSYRLRIVFKPVNSCSFVTGTLRILNGSTNTNIADIFMFLQ